MTILQKAENIMLQGKPCLITLRNGKKFECAKITKTSITIIGNTIGSIGVLPIDHAKDISVEDIENIEIIGETP